jgi:hypothetical protein
MKTKYNWSRQDAMTEERQLLNRLLGAVTRTEFGRAKIGKPSSDSGRGGDSPRTDGFLSEDAERAAGCEMALDVEDPMESG